MKNEKMHRPGMLPAGRSWCRHTPARTAANPMIRCSKNVKTQLPPVLCRRPAVCPEQAGASRLPAVSRDGRTPHPFRPTR